MARMWGQNHRTNLAGAPRGTSLAEFRVGASERLTGPRWAALCLSLFPAHVLFLLYSLECSLCLFHPR